MPNGWSNKSYLQGFYCETVTFKVDANMFELMDIYKTIYEVVVEKYC